MNWKGFLTAAIAIAASALALTGLAAALASTGAENAAVEQLQMMTLLLPGSSDFSKEPYEGEDENITAVYKSDAGYVVETTTAGYAGPIVQLTGVDNSGTVTGTVIRKLQETHGLGRQALSDTGFLAQFLGTTGAAAVGEDIDALTGATVTSKAVARGVNSAAAFVSGADVSSSATEWGG